MVKQKAYRGEWKSDRAEAKFRAKEAVVWERAKPPPEKIDVATRFGSTRAYRWAGAGTPVVFLHGMTDTSVRWIRYAEALKGRDVYALDVVGEVGHSQPDVGFTSAAEYAIWLDDALDALGISRPHVVGASLGGYIAVGFATLPNRVTSVIALDPVGIVDLKLVKLIAWSARCAVASYAPESIRLRLADRLRQPLLADKEAMALLLQAQRGHPVRVPPCTVFTDEQLRSITALVNVLVGADSVAFDNGQLVDRVNTVIPQGAARLLPEAGHGFSDSHFEDCINVIRKAIDAPAAAD